MGIRKYLIISILFIGCSESSILGDDFVDSKNFSVLLIDTVSIEYSTIKFDSVPTSNTGNLLVGHQSETEIGDVRTKSFFLVGYDETENTEIDDSYEFDSITLTLPMDGYTLFLDDEGVRSTLTVQRLDWELIVGDDGFLYNDSHLEGITNQEGHILAQKDFFWASDRVRDIELRLPDLLGTDLFKRLKDEDEIFSDPLEMSEYLRGFSISLGEEAPFVSFAKDGVKLTLHATDNSTSQRTNLEFNFTIGENPYFTSYYHDNIPEGLALEGLDEEIISDDLEDKSYMISGLGYATKLDLKGIRNILLGGDDFILTDALLQVEWFETEHEFYPDRLLGTLVDEDLVEVTPEAFYLNLVLDDEYGRENYYEINLTVIFEFILDQPSTDNFFLIITEEGFGSSCNYTILGDESYDSRLNIYTISN